MGISLITAPATLAFVGTPIAAMPQVFVLATDRYTAGAKTGVAVADNGSGKVRYTYASHPFKVGDVITGSAYTAAGLNVRQTITDIASGTFDTDLAWSSAYGSLTGTVTRTNDNLQFKVIVNVGGQAVATGYQPVDSSGRVSLRVDRALLISMEPTRPPLDDQAELDTETFLSYSVYAQEQFDDVDGVLKTANDYTSGTYYAAYGYRQYKEARTTTAYMLTLGSYRSLLTRRPAATPIVLPVGSRIWVSGLIEGGVGINEVRVASVQQDSGGTETTETGDQVSTADAYCKVVGCYGPDIYTADVATAKVWLMANGTTRISEELNVIFTSAQSNAITLYWLNYIGGWDSITLTHYKRIERNVTSKSVAWSAESASYTVGDPLATVFNVDAQDGCTLRGQVPANGASRAFAGIMESEQVYMIDVDGVVLPVIVDGDGVTYRESDEIVYFDIELTYAIKQI